MAGLTVIQLADAIRTIYGQRREILRIPDEKGGYFILRGSDAANTQLVPGDTTGEWRLQLRRGVDGVRGQLELTGGEARRMAARVLPHVNQFGSNRKELAAAVKHLEEAGDPQRFLAWAARMRNWRYTGTIWLGVEMAVNEENERIALQDELALLEEAWKEAEEIAAIADRLTLPALVEQRLGELKRDHA